MQEGRFSTVHHDGEASLDLTVLPLRPAIQAGVDNIVGVMLVVSVRADDACADNSAADVEMHQWPAFEDLRVRLKSRGEVTWGFHTAMCQDSYGTWTTPDLHAGQSTIGLARIVLPAKFIPPADDEVCVATFLLWGSRPNEQLDDHLRIQLYLPVVSAGEYAETEENPSVQKYFVENEGHLDASWQMVDRQ